MPGKSSRTPDEILLHSFQIDWPYEVVCAQAKVAAIPSRNIFRWAIFRIMEDFRDAPPSLEECADQLGILEPAFLKDTLEELIAEGVMEKIESSKPTDPPNCRILSNSKGADGKVAPETHGFLLHFDAITGEHLEQLFANLNEDPAVPLVPLDKLPPPRTQIGLDHARRFAERQQEPFVNPESRIIEVQIEPQMGSFIWLPITANIILDNGIMHCRLTQATEQQQQRIDDLDFDRDIFDRILRSAIDEKFYPVLDCAMPFEKWQEDYESLIKPDDIAHQAISLVAGAANSLLLDAYWLNFPAISDVVQRQAKAGLSVRVCARNCQLADLPPWIAAATEIYRLSDCPRVGIITDTKRAISLDTVDVGTPAAKRKNIITSSFLKPESVLKLHQQLKVAAIRP